MRIIYITDTDIKSPGAAMNRARLFVTGLQHNNVLCDAILTPVCNRGSKYGIIGRIYCSVANWYRCSNTIKKIKPNDIVVIYGQHPIISYGKKLKKKGAIIIAERTEYPFDLINQNSSTVLKADSDRFRRNLHYADYFITCSSALEEYYAQFTKAKMIRLPLVLDAKYLQTIIPNNIELNYTIAYCGDMGNNKDGVPTLVDAFIIAATKNQNLKLLLMGDASEPQILEQLKNKINQNGLTDKVEFTGRIPNTEVIKKLSTAALCVLSRPNNLQAKGGIPSKMGEYLGLGRPSLFTAVGDIPKILTDNQTAFICQADNTTAFANKILEIFDNYDHTLQVGHNGYKFIQQFDYINQSKILLNFLQQNVQR